MNHSMNASLIAYIEKLPEKTNFLKNMHAEEQLSLTLAAKALTKGNA